jgi:hypothetical protein
MRSQDFDSFFPEHASTDPFQNGGTANIHDEAQQHRPDSAPVARSSLSKVTSWATFGSLELDVLVPALKPGLKTVPPKKRALSYKQNLSDPSNKEELYSPLHAACLDSGTTAREIESLLCRDHDAACRPVKVKKVNLICHPLTRKPQKQIVNELFAYPLHIAIRNGLGQDVIGILINAAPGVLNMRDGPQLETPLALLLRTRPQNINLVDVMLLKQPSCVSIRDRHDNTVIHLVCIHGGTVDVLHHLCMFFPLGLKRRNFHGKTPYQVCQERVTCSEAVLAFLAFMSESENQGLC